MAQATSTTKAVIKKDEIAGQQEQGLAELDPTGSAAREAAEIQSAYVMAKRFPRDEKKCAEKLNEACKRLSFAEEASYAFKRGDSEINGPSAPFAREAARIWTNIRFGLKIVRDDDEVRTIKGWALDLETNSYDDAEDHFKKLVQRKIDGQTKWVVPDERDLRELTNRRGAISIRNCILSIIPRDIIDEAQAIAEDVLMADAERNAGDRAKAIVTTFSQVFVSKAELETYLGHPLEKVSKEEIVKLRGIARSIRDGMAKKEEFFGGDSAAQQKSNKQNLDELAEKMKAGKADDKKEPETAKTEPQTEQKNETTQGATKNFF